MCVCGCPSEYCQHAQWILPVNSEIPTSAISSLVTSCTLHSKPSLPLFSHRLTAGANLGRKRHGSWRTLAFWHYIIILCWPLLDLIFFFCFYLFVSFLNEKEILILYCEITCSRIYSTVQICLHNLLKKWLFKEPHVYHCSPNECPYFFLNILRCQLLGFS